MHGPGIDEPLALLQSKNTYYYHADGLGSIVALTDAKGKVAQEYQYDSFGNLHDQMNRVKQPYTYTGREWDRETGLYYYRARYYDPQVGRFISRDPIGFKGGINLFSYTGGNPVNFTDPSGLYCGSGWNEFLIPDKPCGYNFSACCKKHDDCYGCKGSKAGKTKQDCDSEFNGCMKNVCATRKYPSQTSGFDDSFSGLSSPGLSDCLRVANDYYLAVNKFGNKAFKKARTECCDK